MTALDQAFIEAYRRHTGAPRAADAPEAAAPPAPPATAAGSPVDAALAPGTLPASGAARPSPGPPAGPRPDFSTQVSVVGAFEPFGEPAAESLTGPLPEPAPQWAPEPTPEPSPTEPVPGTNEADRAVADRPAVQPLPPVVRPLRQPPAEGSFHRVDEPQTPHPARAALGRPAAAASVEAAPMARTGPGFDGDWEPPAAEPEPWLPAESTDRAAPPKAAEAAETTHQPAAPGPFRPMLQVDRFAWPPVSGRLGLSAGDELDRLAESLLAARDRGIRVIGMVGHGPGDGATTAVLCAARQLARRGVRLALLDGNADDPQLARRLGLLPEFGIEELLAGRQPLEEMAIESVGDSMVVVPLGRPCAEASEDGLRRLGRAVETMAEAYDLVLVDLGSADGPAPAGGWLVRSLARQLGGVVYVCRARDDAAAEKLLEAGHGLAEPGVEVLGLVENFTRG